MRAVDGIHDLGGMHGFGAVHVERNEPTFHARWEGRVFAMAGLVSAAGLANTDRFRHAIERLPPVMYLTAGYYGRWLAALETLVAENTRSAGAGGGSRRDDARGAPRFASGDAVTARNLHPPGHTRLPRYVRGRRGVVERVQPSGWVFPDTNAHGRGEHAQHVYAVRFAGHELWGDDAEPDTSVTVDLFEDYLEPSHG